MTKKGILSFSHPSPFVQTYLHVVFFIFQCFHTQVKLCQAVFVLKQKHYQSAAHMFTFMFKGGEQCRGVVQENKMFQLEAYTICA